MCVCVLTDTDTGHAHAELSLDLHTQHVTGFAFDTTHPASQSDHDPRVGRVAQRRFGVRLYTGLLRYPLTPYIS